MQVADSGPWALDDAHLQVCVFGSVLLGVFRRGVQAADNAAL